MEKVHLVKYKFTKKGYRVYADGKIAVDKYFDNFIVAQSWVRKNLIFDWEHFIFYKPTMSGLMWTSDFSEIQLIDGYKNSDVIKKEFKNSFLVQKKKYYSKKQVKSKIEYLETFKTKKEALFFVKKELKKDGKKL